MVKTVNSLPDDYRGKCDILLNDINPLVVNRNIIILHALITAGPSIEEAAELAMHLMYSVALPRAVVAHLYRSVNAIYGQNAWKGQPIMSAHWNGRGKGELRAIQPEEDMANPLKMLFSSYSLPVALSNMREIMFHPDRIDYRDRHIAALQPSHRMAFMHFRKTCILAPFSYDTSHFTEPNRSVVSSECHMPWLLMYYSSDFYSPLRESG